MPAFREGKVVEILEERPGLQRARVALIEPAEEIVAACYEALQPLEVGDVVIVNTTGLELGLGTGGEGFVVWVEGEGRTYMSEGHVIKLRYTPWQTEVLAAEAPESEHHIALVDADSLDATPVVSCGLHSQIAGVCAGIKAARPDARIGYLMSDGGALPLAWSNTVHALKAAGLLEFTCTYGHAFGGDLEAVNLYSGLIAAHIAGPADVIVAAMGPGGVGTGTRLGFSGIELAQVVDAAGALSGQPIACLRVSFADERDRHQGVSHHSLTSLRLIARPCRIAVPLLPAEQEEVIAAQLRGVNVEHRHELVETDGSPGVALLRERGLDPQTMGRPMSEADEPFLAAAAAGAVAASLL